MLHAAATLVINQKMLDDVGTPEGIVVQLPNAPDITTPETEYIWFGPIEADDELVGMGGVKTYRAECHYMAQVFMPAETGIKRALEIADVIKTAFRSTSVASGVTFRTPRVTYQGRDEDSTMWQVNVDVPFYAEEVV